MAQIAEVAEKELLEKIRSEKALLVDVWAPWCGPCRMLGPVLERIAERFAGQLSVVKLNADQYPEFCNQNGIMSIPTLILYRDGEEVGRKVGFQPEPALVQFLSEQLAQYQTVSNS